MAPRLADPGAAARGPGESDRAPVLEISGLRVDAPSGWPIVDDVSLRVDAGEVIGIVGESGAGKTTTALAIMGYTPAGAAAVRGEVVIAGTVMPLGDERGARAVRGRLVSYVPQSPGTALNPATRVRDVLAGMARAHPRASGGGRADALLRRVDLPNDKDFQKRFPHQLSGGQQQRLCIATALVCDPPLIVLDEPTTGLDVITQAKILNELRRLRQQQDVSLLYVSHDLAAVAQIADRIVVMYAGRIVEDGPARQVLNDPKHPYTSGLVASTPDHLDPGRIRAMSGVSAGVGERPAGCGFAPRCPLRQERCEAAVPELRAVSSDHVVRCLRVGETQPTAQRPIANHGATPAGPRDSRDDAPLLAVSELRAEHGTGRHRVTVVEGIDLAVARGECVALVGESGSGKTTVARTIVGLHPIAGGRVALRGEPLCSSVQERTIDQRRQLQFIFQNPAEALNPRQNVRTAIARPARSLRKVSARDADREVDELLDLIRLPRRIAGRYPPELSGGELQRVVIARALIAQPDLLVCDEITSALDVSVQAAVLELLEHLRQELHLGLLFITHDLGVVSAIADHVLVLEKGHICDSGTPEKVIRNPAHVYTRRLVEAAPSLHHPQLAGR